MLCDISMFTGNVVVAVGIGIYTPNTSWLSRNTVSNSSTYSSTSYEWVALHYTLESEKRLWVIALKYKNFIINVVKCQQKPLKSKFLPLRDSVLVTTDKNDQALWLGAKQNKIVCHYRFQSNVEIFIWNWAKWAAEKSIQNYWNGKILRNQNSHHLKTNQPNEPIQKQ